jgi:hypothetical protein
MEVFKRTVPGNGGGSSSFTNNVTGEGSAQKYTVRGLMESDGRQHTGGGGRVAGAVTGKGQRLPRLGNEGELVERLNESLSKEQLQEEKLLGMTAAA